MFFLGYTSTMEVAEDTASELFIINKVCKHN